MRKLVLILSILALTISINAQSNCNTWLATDTLNSPPPLLLSTAIWTGTEMIVWGQLSVNNGPQYGVGGKYNPATDSWITTSIINAPALRYEHSAVWTGTEMIIWGGYTYVNYSPYWIYYNTGGKYNPITDSWMATSTINAPAARSKHLSVWTGTEMIIWGGGYAYATNDGYKYNPNTDLWTTMSTVNAPPNILMSDISAIWTGTEMIIWGFYSKKYNPLTDIWTTISTINGSSSKANHSAVWTGSEMIIWGGWSYGLLLNTGAKYDPVTDSWVTMSTINAPIARSYHTAVYNNCNDMIIWGGSDSVNYLNTGGIYNIITDTWTSTPTINTPYPRREHSAVWTGNEMIIWGGMIQGSPSTGSCTKEGGRLILCCNNIIIPSYATATSDTICDGQSTTLGISGGNLISGANWNWYTGSCGGTYVISGTSPILNPTTTTTYYVRGEGASNTTTCVSITVNVNSFSSNPASVLATPGLINSGSSSTLSFNNGSLGSGANWYWYSGTCGGINEGIGISLTVMPTITTDYYVRAEGLCNTTNCISVTVVVNTTKIYSIDNNLIGINIYPNPTNSSFTIRTNKANANIKIFNLKGQLIIEQKLIGNENTIDIKDLSCGVYIIEVVSDKNIYHSKIIK